MTEDTNATNHEAAGILACPWCGSRDVRVLTPTNIDRSIRCDKCRLTIYMHLALAEDLKEVDGVWNTFREMKSLIESQREEVDLLKAENNRIAEMYESLSADRKRLLTNNAMLKTAIKQSAPWESCGDYADGCHKDCFDDCSVLVGALDKIK